MPLPQQDAAPTTDRFLLGLKVISIKPQNKEPRPPCKLGEEGGPQNIEVNNIVLLLK
jgi:hypothetical protein